MTKIVVDTNIIFSTLLNINSRIAQILINSSALYDFYAPEFLRIEIIKHKSKIQKLGNFSEDDFLELYETIMKHVTVINTSLISKSYFENAFNLCSDVDVNDTEFVATCEFVEGILWTGDLKLMKGLEKKDYMNFITTEDLFEKFMKDSKNL